MEIKMNNLNAPSGFRHQWMEKKALRIRRSKEKALDKGVQAVSFAVKLLNSGMKKKKIVQHLMKNYCFRVREARIVYKVAHTNAKTMTKEGGTPHSEAVSVERVSKKDKN